MSSEKTEMNLELINPLKERLTLLMTDDDLKHPFAWATRIGLAKGTFSGIWNLGRNSVHKSTADKIAAGTGANARWIMDGVGQPFGARLLNAQEQIEDNETREQTQARWDVINKGKLEEYRLERVREDQRVERKARAALILDGAIGMNPPECIYSPNPQVMELAISTLYEALAATKKSMPPAAQTKMILNLYSLFSTSQQGDNIKNYVLELIRSLGATTEIEA